MFLVLSTMQSYGSPAEDIDDFDYSEEAFDEDLDHRSCPILDQDNPDQGLYVQETGQTEQDTLVILRGGRIRRIMEGFKGVTDTA